MCILPNFEARDLATLEQNRKKQTKKAVGETVKVIIPEQPLLENSI
jgi:hypothetical protein